MITLLSGLKSIIKMQVILFLPKSIVTFETNIYCRLWIFQPKSKKYSKNEKDFDEQNIWAKKEQLTSNIKSSSGNVIYKKRGWLCEWTKVMTKLHVKNVLLHKIRISPFLQSKFCKFARVLNYFKS